MKTINFGRQRSAAFIAEEPATRCAAVTQHVIRSAACVQSLKASLWLLLLTLTLSAGAAVEEVRLATVTTSGWTFYPFLNGGGSQQHFSTTSSVATSHLQNPAPQAVYKKIQAEWSTLTWGVSDLAQTGSYKVRIHLSSVQFPWYSQVSQTLTVNDANGSYSIPNVTPYLSGGFNVGMIVEFPQNLQPSAQGEIGGLITPTAAGNWVVVSGVEVFQNP